VPVERHLLTLTSEDGEEHDAILHIDERAARVRERSTGRRTGVVHVHGALGNFLVGTLRFYPGPLARAGFPVLVVETRLANVAQLLGSAIFDEATLDIDAGVRWLRDNGFRRVVVSGLSSGAALATRYAATRHVPYLRGLIALSMPWGLPQSMRARAERYGAEPSYLEMTRIVRDAVSDPHAEMQDRIFVAERTRGPSRIPAHAEVYTYRTWWSTRGPNAMEAMPFRQIGQVWAPILLVQGTADELVAVEEAHALARVARRHGNDKAEVGLVPGADHLFKKTRVALIDTVTRWLRARA
jgi:alpha-beta hydrolase superfamily lysophospholipase